MISLPARDITEIRIPKCIWNKQLRVTENNISYVIKMSAIKFEACGAAAKQTYLQSANYVLPRNIIISKWRSCIETVFFREERSDYAAVFHSQNSLSQGIRGDFPEPPSGSGARAAPGGQGPEQRLENPPVLGTARLLPGKSTAAT